MTQRTITFGIIGCGRMGREFASAAARWYHLEGLDTRPMIVAACDVDTGALDWFERNLPDVRSTDDYTKLLDDDTIDAIYCAVTHDVHEQFYTDIFRSGKHLPGEKHFGIDKAANEAFNAVIEEHPDMLVRCSSEFPFFPGAYRLFQWARQQRFGRIIEVEAGFSHSSDLNPEKTVDWKRMVDVKGAYGCMEDLGQLAHGKDMQQPFHCGIPSEAASSHDRFTSALTSHSQQKALPLTP